MTLSVMGSLIHLLQSTADPLHSLARVEISLPLSSALRTLTSVR
jgi:hypothetical protein